VKAWKEDRNGGTMDNGGTDVQCTHTHAHWRMGDKKTKKQNSKKNFKKKAMMKHKYFERQDGWYRLYGHGASNAEGPRSNLTGKVIDSKRKVSSPLDVVF